MAVSNVKRIVIEFDTDADGPRGSVSVPNGSSTPFDGWLQLLAALEQLIAATPVGEALTMPMSKGRTQSHETA